MSVQKCPIVNANSERDGGDTGSGSDSVDGNSPNDDTAITFTPVLGGVTGRGVAMLGGGTLRIAPDRSFSEAMLGTTSIDNGCECDQPTMRDALSTLETGGNVLGICK